MNLNFSKYSKELLFILRERGKTDAIQEEAEKEIIKRFPSEENLKSLTLFGKTAVSTQSPFDASKDLSEGDLKTLAYLSKNRRTKVVREQSQLEYIKEFPSKDVLIDFATHGETDAIAEAAFDALENPSNENLAFLAECGKTETIAQAAFDALKNPSKEILMRLAGFGKTGAIRRSAETRYGTLIKEKYKEIAHLIK